MNRLDLQVRLQNYYQNFAYYTPDTMNDCIQDGIDEVFAFTGVGYNSAVIPFQPNLSYYDMLTICPDYLGVYAIFNRGMNRWMLPTSLRKLDNVRIDWEASNGTPQYFVPISHRYVAIWMKPSSAGYGNMYMLYRSSAPTLFDNTQIPIPGDHITALEQFCIQDMWEMQQEFSKAGLMMGEYEKSLEELRVYIRNKRDPDRMQSLRG